MTLITIKEMEDLPMPKFKKLLSLEFNNLVSLYDKERARLGRGFMLMQYDGKEHFDVSYLPEENVKNKHKHAKRLLENSSTEDMNNYMYIMAVENKKVVTVKLLKEKPSETKPN